MDGFCAWACFSCPSWGRAARPKAIIPVTTTIQAAIDAATDGDTISIPAGIYTESLTIGKNLTLAGQINSSVTIQAVAGHRVITVTPGHDLTLQGLNLTLGAGVLEGGAVRIEDGTLTIERCYLYNNQASYGGAIYHGGTGQIIVRMNSYIYNNHATIQGGGIYANGNLSLNFSSMYSNVADSHGGAATVWAGSLSVVGGVFSSNQAGGNGGAFNANNSVYVDQAAFTSNTAGADGGAILQWNETNGLSVIIQTSTFDLNQAGSTGGALSVRQGAVTTITQSQFTNNQVVTAGATNIYGGAVYFSGASLGHSLTITDTTFRSNKLTCACSYPSGGGLYATTSSSGVVNLVGDTFVDNDGWLGGGVFANKAIIDRTTFQGNSAGDGAGAYLSGASQVKKSAFFQNNAVNGGGGLLVTTSAPSLVLEDSRFIGNSGGHDLGGTMAVDAQAINMKNVAVTDTQVLSGSAISFSAANSTISLRHLTVNDTHLAGGARTGTFGIHLKGPNPPTIVNIWNSIITNHGTGVKIDAGGACSLDHTLWYGNALNIDGSAGSYADYYPVFSNPAYAVDRYHLTRASGAIDHGVDRLVYTDLDGDSRDSLPDLGADEYRAHLYLPVVRR